MKKQASNIVKNIMSFLSSIAKAKLLGEKIKADAARARFAVFSLLKRRRLSLDLISHRIHALLDKNRSSGYEGEDEEECNAIVTVKSDNHMAPESHILHDYRLELDFSDDKYPDLTHSLFEDDEDDDSELQGGDGGSSIIDLMKNSNENQGQDFILENEIDHVADMFIKRFRKQMRLQKLESFKRSQAMLVRNS